MAEARLPFVIGIPETGEKRLKIAIARIQSERINHKRLLRACVEAVYDSCAKEFLNGESEFTDELLSQLIPLFVFTVAVEQKWLPRFKELCRRDLVGGEVGYFLNVEVVGSDLDYQRLFVRALDGRIAHWRVKALEKALEPPAETSPIMKIEAQELKTVVSGLSNNSRRKAVDAYIEEVFSRTGKRINRTDIWKHAAYKSRTEFEKWERNDPKKVNKTAHERFTGILTKKPHLN